MAAPTRSSRPQQNPRRMTLGEALSGPQRNYQTAGETNPFAEAEFRSDLDSLLRNDPIARLGYEGGVKYLDQVGPDGTRALNEVGVYVPSNRKVRQGDIELLTFLNEGYPVEPDDVAYTPGYGSSKDVIVHEMRHRGIDRLKQMYEEDPMWFADTFGVDTANAIHKLSYGKEEGLVELGDNHEATWIKPDGETRKMEETITRPFADKEYATKVYQGLQSAADYALSKKEPPKTVPNEPNSFWGKLFGGPDYVKPEGYAEGGLNTGRRGRNKGRTSRPQPDPVDEQMHVLGFSLPMDANPKRDRFVGFNEWGYEVKETIGGNRYFIRPATEEEKPTHITEGVKRVVKTVGDVVRGDVPLPSAKQVADLAVNIVQGGYQSVHDTVRNRGTVGDLMAAAVAPGAPGVARAVVTGEKVAEEVAPLFGGLNSTTGKRFMEEHGDKPGIPKGMWAGRDGKPRFEIDDSQSKLNMDALDTEEVTGYKGANFVPTKTANLGDFLVHDILYEEYPDLKMVNVKVAPLEGTAVGKYNPWSDTITVKAGMSLEDTRKTVIHETQHAIQAREGFAPGTNPKAAALYGPTKEELKDPKVHEAWRQYKQDSKDFAENFVAPAQLEFVTKVGDVIDDLYKSESLSDLDKRRVEGLNHVLQDIGQVAINGGASNRFWRVLQYMSSDWLDVPEEILLKHFDKDTVKKIRATTDSGEKTDAYEYEHQLDVLGITDKQPKEPFYAKPEVRVQDMVDNRYNAYMREMGEVEARNAEGRLNMTAEQRAVTDWKQTEDVPPEYQWSEKHGSPVMSESSSGPKAKENPLVRSRREVVEDTDVQAPYSFYSPIRQTVENMDFGKNKVVSGAAIQSELNRVLNQGGGIRNAELMAVDLPIDPKKKYTKEEALQLVYENTWEIKPVYENVHSHVQRIFTEDPVEDYVEITLEANKPKAGTFEPAGKNRGDPGTHYTPNTVAHARLSQRVGEDGDYLLVEEYQSDLFAKGAKPKVKGQAPISVEEYDKVANQILDEKLAEMPKPFKKFNDARRQLILNEIKPFLANRGRWVYEGGYDRIHESMGFRGLDLFTDVAEDLQDLVKGREAIKNAPFAKDEDWLRLAVLSTIAEAQKRGLNRIAIPSAENLAEIRYTIVGDQGGFGVHKPLTESQKTGFYKLYGKTLDKVIRQIEQELGPIKKESKVLPAKQDPYRQDALDKLSEDISELEDILDMPAEAINELPYEELLKEIKIMGAPNDRLQEIAKTFYEDYFQFTQIKAELGDTNVRMLYIDDLPKMDESDMRFAQGGLVDNFSPDSFAEYLEEANG